MSTVVNIDAGHGSNTAGKRTPPMPVDVDLNGDGVLDIRKGDQFREHYANTYVANYLRYELARCGIRTNQTGWNDANALDDPDVAITKRQDAVRAAKCKVSVSIHFNAYGDGKSFNDANGLGVFIHSDAGKCQDSKTLAQILRRYLVQGTPQKDRGIKTGNLGMCNATYMGCQAAVLCELAFMTNEHEAVTMMANDAYYREAAEEIAKGICEYLGVSYVAEGGAAADKSTSPADPKELKVGDPVTFTGNTHYTNSYPPATAKGCKPGPAVVTAISAGKVHPYHLKGVKGKGSTVNGWVNAEDVQR